MTMPILARSNDDASRHREDAACRWASLIRTANTIPAEYLGDDLLDACQLLHESAAQRAWFAIVAEAVAGRD
jgi:hypothetical protein